MKNQGKTLLAELCRTPDYQKLTEDQKQFFTHYFNGKNILLTGPAGTGKSFCVKTLFSFLREKGISIGKTATTGVAALNIEGATLHSWSGIGLGDEDVKSLIQTVGRNKKARERIINVDTLIVDEISMASGTLLNKIDIIFQYFRLNNDPFGGIQMVFIGDFLQLPPIFKNLQDEDDFAFRSVSWKKADVKLIHLNKIMRQDDNSPFVEMLNAIRLGDASKLSTLQSRIEARFPDDGIKPIKIFCKNIDVDRVNQTELSKLPTPAFTFYSKDDGLEHHIKAFDRNCPAAKTIQLKQGAQVMLLHNLEVSGGLVNGSIGVVEGFTKEGPIVRFTNGRSAIIEAHEWSIKEQAVGVAGKITYRVVATRKQIPLKLAWATTCHKVQGCTVDRAEIDLNEAFSCGQVYVALSRVRSLDSLSVKDFSPSKIMVNEECLRFYQNLGLQEK